jgi:UDP-N-acetylglucosamine 2-epimerase (non-hydrolysing)
MKKTIHLIAAARPNFMKIAPLYHVLAKEDWARTHIVHTGQHYDLNMSDSFFGDLGLPEPHIQLGVGSGTHAEQTGRVMIAYEKVLLDRGPDLVIVVGDVNSTVASALASVKLGVPVAHLEGGLRSFDRTMPEEINRVVTDALADLLWTPSPDADENLLREGIPREKIQRVGNIMIDSLEMLRPRVEKEEACETFNLSPGEFGLVTLHRPANVDSPSVLEELCIMLSRVARKIPLIFPVHPRTMKNIKDHNLLSLLSSVDQLQLLDPLSYIPFMNLVFNSSLVITDSGGLQEETTYLGIPCLTIRPNTERPITISLGTNRLCSPTEIASQVDAILTNTQGEGSVPELWDGQTAGRVVQSMREFLSIN